MQKHNPKRKENFLDIAMETIQNAHYERTEEELFAVIRKALIQSFKNGIEVGIKRVHQKQKHKSSTPEE